MDNARFSNLPLYPRSLAAERETALAPIALRVQFGRRADLEAVKFMARRALDLMPASLEALEVLELLTPRSQRLLLRARYEAFLTVAPAHPEATRVRETLIDVLLEHRHYERGLRHIALLARAWLPAHPSQEIARACSVPLPTEDPPAPIDEYEELDELDLEPCEEWEWNALAFIKAAAQ
jgi:hypothetical protein